MMSAVFSQSNNFTERQIDATHWGIMTKYEPLAFQQVIGSFHHSKHLGRLFPQGEVVIMGKDYVLIETYIF